MLYKDTLTNFLCAQGIGVASSELPIDFGVLFTGIEYRFNEIESTRERSRQRSIELLNFLDRVITNIPITNPSRLHITELLKLRTDQDLDSNIDQSNFKILEGFETIFRQMHDESTTDAFIDTIRKI